MGFDRDLLVRACRLWELDNRAGNCLNEADAVTMPLDERAEQSADALLRYLDEAMAA